MRRPLSWLSSLRQLAHALLELQREERTGIPRPCKHLDNAHQRLVL
jgi:hypothetical protein